MDSKYYKWLAFGSIFAWIFTLLTPAGFFLVGAIPPATTWSGLFWSTQLGVWINGLSAWWLGAIPSMAVAGAGSVWSFFKMKAAAAYIKSRAEAARMVAYAKSFFKWSFIKKNWLEISAVIVVVVAVLKRNSYRFKREAKNHEVAGSVTIVVGAVVGALAAISRDDSVRAFFEGMKNVSWMKGMVQSLLDFTDIMASSDKIAPVAFQQANGKEEEESDAGPASTPEERAELVSRGQRLFREKREKARQEEERVAKAALDSREDTNEAQKHFFNSVILETEQIKANEGVYLDTLTSYLEFFQEQSFWQMLWGAVTAGASTLLAVEAFGWVRTRYSAMSKTSQTRVRVMLIGLVIGLIYYFFFYFREGRGIRKMAERKVGDVRKRFVKWDKSIKETKHHPYDPDKAVFYTEKLQDKYWEEYDRAYNLYVDSWGMPDDPEELEHLQQYAASTAANFIQDREEFLARKGRKARRSTKETDDDDDEAFMDKKTGAARGVVIRCGSCNQDVALLLMNETEEQTCTFCEAQIKTPKMFKPTTVEKIRAVSKSIRDLGYEPDRIPDVKGKTRDEQRLYVLAKLNEQLKSLQVDHKRKIVSKESDQTEVGNDDDSEDYRIAALHQQVQDLQAQLSKFAGYQSPDKKKLTKGEKKKIKQEKSKQEKVKDGKQETVEFEAPIPGSYVVTPASDNAKFTLSVLWEENPWKGLTKVGNRLVTCRHGGDHKVGDTLKIGKYEGDKCVGTATTVVSELGKGVDPDAQDYEDIMYLSLPHEPQFQSIKSKKAKVLDKPSPCVIQWRKNGEHRLYESSGNADPVTRLHRISTLTGASGSALQDLTYSTAFGIHIGNQGPSQNRWLPFTDAMVSVLNSPSRKN